MGADPEPTEEDYTRAAEDALHRGDLRLALVQLGGALSYRPNAPELRALLDLALTRARDPLGLLPHTGSAFFGVGAVRAAAFARSGELGKAIVQLLDVVSFRPTAPFLPWLDEWRARGLRGVGLDVVIASVARFHAAIDREGEVALENLVALSGLLEALRRERPKAGESLLRLEVITCRLAGDLERADALVDRALQGRPSAVLLFERSETARRRGDLVGAEASLRRACELAPRDVDLALDLAEAQLRAGLWEAAVASYEALRGSTKAESVDRALRALSALRHPSDDALRHEVLASQLGELSPELDLALRMGRTALPAWWDDGLRETLDAILADLSRRRPPRAVRVRLELDHPLPTSAQVLFAAKASALGVQATLGDEPASLETPGAAPLEAETAERVRTLMGRALDLDAWARGDQGLTLQQAKQAFAAPLPGSPSSMDDFEWQRLATLSLALRDARSPDCPALAWALTLASGDDAWAARAALLALGAVLRRQPRLAPPILEAAAAALARDDGRGDAAHALRLHVEGAVHDEERRASFTHFARSLSVSHAGAALTPKSRVRRRMRS